VRVFVTGATGFVGSHLVEALLSRGHHVSCLVRSPEKAARVFGPTPPVMVPGDLDHPSALRAGAKNADLVFHIAGLTAARDLDEFLTVNYGGTERTLAAAAETAPRLTRFVYVSSLAAVGPTRRGSPATETSNPHPVSNYGMSKLAGEAATRVSSLPWTIVRPPAVYGPRDVELLRVFKLARLGLAPEFGHGRQELSFVHVTDLVEGLIAAATGTEPGKVYCACHSEIVTVREFVEHVHAAVRDCTGPAGRPARPPRRIQIPLWIAKSVLTANGTLARMLGRRTLLSADKSRELLADAWTCAASALERDTDWTARIPLREGLPATARWYREHGWL
jgi:nucleoside-diphosphate-sugar epimerase